MTHTDNDTCTEELAHVEMISAMLYQLTKDLSVDEIKKSGFEKYFVDHTLGIYSSPASAPIIPVGTFTSSHSTE